MDVKSLEMLVVSLRSVNHGFCSHLKYSPVEAFKYSFGDELMNWHAFFGCVTGWRGILFKT